MSSALRCVETDENEPMVCCGCRTIGPPQSSRRWGSWFITGVIRVGRYEYETACHCGDPVCDEAAWPLSKMEQAIAAGEPVVIHKPSALVLMDARMRKPFLNAVDLPLDVSRSKIVEAANAEAAA